MLLRNKGTSPTSIPNTHPAMQTMSYTRGARVQDSLCDSESLRGLRKLLSRMAAKRVAGAVFDEGLQAVIIAQDCRSQL
jgi:hypothetical protein